MKHYRITGKLLLELKVDSTAYSDSNEHAAEETLRYYERLGFRVISYDIHVTPMKVH